MTKSTTSQPVVAPVFLVAFSGHRPKKGEQGRSSEDLAACQIAIEKALTEFKSQAEEVGGSVQLLTSLAEGADLAAAAAAEELKLPTHFFLPVPEEQFKEDFTEVPEVWKEVERHLRRVEKEGNACTLRISPSNHRTTDSDIYADTNFALLSHADALITIAIDPTISCGSEFGSQQVWRDAGERRLPRINIDPRSQRINEVEDVNLFATYSSDHPRCGLELLSELTDHLGLSLACQGRHECIQKAKDAFDQRANSISKLVRKALKNIILCHGAASLLAGFALAGALAFGKSYPVLLGLAFAELLLIGFAEYLHRKHHHDGIIWLRCRAAAENLSMLSNMRSHLDPLETIVGTHSPSWRRFVLSFNLQSGPPPIMELEKAKAEYLEGRIEDQITYFTQKNQESARPSKNLYRAMRVSSIGAFFVVLFAVIDKASHSFHWTESYLPAWLTFLLYFLPVALPLLAGAFLPLRQSLDLSRRQHRFPQVVALLKEARNDLNIVHSPYTLKKVVLQVEESLLDERLEFEMAQEIGFEH